MKKEQFFTSLDEGIFELMFQLIIIYIDMFLPPEVAIFFESSYYNS